MTLVEYLRNLLGKEYYDKRVNFELRENALKEEHFMINSKIKFDNHKHNPFDEGCVYHFKIENDTFVMTDFIQSSNFRENKIYHYNKSAENFTYILSGLTEKYFLNKKLQEKMPEKNSKEKIKKI